MPYARSQNSARAIDHDLTAQVGLILCAVESGRALIFASTISLRWSCHEVRRYGNRGAGTVEVGMLRCRERNMLRRRWSPGRHQPSSSTAQGRELGRNHAKVSPVAGHCRGRKRAVGRIIAERSEPSIGLKPAAVSARTRGPDRRRIAGLSRPTRPKARGVEVSAFTQKRSRRLTTTMGGESQANRNAPANSDTKQGNARSSSRSERSGQRAKPQDPRARERRNQRRQKKSDTRLEPCNSSSISMTRSSTRSIFDRRSANCGGRDRRVARSSFRAMICTRADAAARERSRRIDNSLSDLSFARRDVLAVHAAIFATSSDAIENRRRGSAHARRTQEGAHPVLLTQAIPICRRKYLRISASLRTSISSTSSRPAVKRPRGRNRTRNTAEGTAIVIETDRPRSPRQATRHDRALRGAHMHSPSATRPTATVNSVLTSAALRLLARLNTNALETVRTAAAIQSPSQRSGHSASSDPSPNRIYETNPRRPKAKSRLTSQQATRVEIRNAWYRSGTICRPR